MNAEFSAIQTEMARQQRQRELIKGKRPSFRVEFRFRRGTRHWEYYETYQECLTAPDSKVCGYSFGGSFIEHPSSRQIQKRGPRGGWSKYMLTRAA